MTAALRIVRDVLATAFGPFWAAWSNHRLVVVFSAVVLLFLWGQHGNLDLVRAVWPEWCGLQPGCTAAEQIVPGLGWDQQLISFAIGALLLVAVPCLIIRLGFRRRLSDFGLGWVAPGQRRFALAAVLVLLALCVPAMGIAAADPGMRAIYPFFRDFTSTADLVAYEVAYLGFFIVIEFVFRGWLLFGLEDAAPSPGAGASAAGKPSLPTEALLWSALAYTIWHYGKPLAELGGTLVWGIATGALVLRMRSIWPIVAVHWIMNVVLDVLVLRSSP